jgi:hypothetical protein
VGTNPFPDDEPLFVITGDNVNLYRDRLTDGHIRMLEQYGPEFVMPVYQTRRSAAFPEDVYGKSRENARSAELLANGNGVRDTIAPSSLAGTITLVHETPDQIRSPRLA